MTIEHRGELVSRARGAARRAHEADRDRFPARHQDWPRWERRARQGRALATALGVPVDHVSVTDDPQRVYGAVPENLLIVTDPGDGRQWRFVPALGATESWLLLDECPDYGATEGCPEEFHTDPAHHPRCGLTTRS